MGRTRQAILDGAAVALQRNGARATTMAEIAAASGVAKATLYNHFRTRAEVYASLAAREVDRLAGILRGAESIEAGLGAAAAWVAAHPLVHAVLDDEPEHATWLLMEDRAPALWGAVREAVADLLRVDPVDPPTDVALRWLASFMTAPGSQEIRQRGAALLAASLTTTVSRPAAGGGG